MTGALTGRLVSLDDDLETINFMPRLSGIPINITRLEEIEAGAAAHT
ncbi:MAG: hypothetical protein ACRYG5_11860 [Janthinobacterium lividum]